MPFECVHPSAPRPCALVAGDSAASVLLMAGTLRSVGFDVLAAPSCARIARHVEAMHGSGRADLLVLDGSWRPWVATAVLATLLSVGKQLPTLLVLRDPSRIRQEANSLGVLEILDSAWRPRALRDAVARIAARFKAVELPAASSAQ